MGRAANWIELAGELHLKRRSDIAGKQEDSLHKRKERARLPVDRHRSAAGALEALIERRVPPADQAPPQEPRKH